MTLATGRRRGCHGRAHDWTARAAGRPAGFSAAAPLRRRRGAGGALALGLAALLIVAAPARAQRVGTLAQWKQRILDPATIGLEPFPGATLNVKFTIDQIRLDESAAKIAVYIIPADRMQAAAEFYAKTLGSTVETSGAGTLGELRIVRAAVGDAKRAGLAIRVENAQWATGKGQILLRYEPQAP